MTDRPTPAGMPDEPQVFKVRRKHVTCTDGVTDSVLSDETTEYIPKQDYDALRLWAIARIGSHEYIWKLAREHREELERDRDALRKLLQRFLSATDTGMSELSGRIKWFDRIFVIRELARAELAAKEPL